jgi:ketosteroid isomerase-like protein
MGGPEEEQYPMKKLLLAAAAAGLTLALSPASRGAPHWPRVTLAGEAEGLLAADRAFSRESGSKGGLEGLEHMFADDVVIFAVPVPGFANGKAEAIAALEKAIGTKQGSTDWTPIRAGISADGTHGFTFGYMTTRIDGQPTKLAKYISYWVKTPLGWRVKLYKRRPRPDGEVSLAMMPPSIPLKTVRAGRAAASPRVQQSLKEREQAFSDLSQKIGLSAAFERFGAPDSVNVGGDAPFVVGAAEIAKVQPPTSSLRWSADQGVLVAPSGDLGVTWGYLHRNGPTPPGRLAQIPFFTVWRRAAPGEPWRYVAE